MISLITVEIPFELTWSTEQNSVNGSNEKILNGATYCLLLSISLLIAWQFQAFFQQVQVFVRDGNLPSERTKRRNIVIITVIWLVFLLDWLSYIGTSALLGESQGGEIYNLAQ